MNDKEKAGVALGVGVAFLLGWWLHKCKPSGGDVNLQLNPESVQYELVDEDGNDIVHSTYLPRNAMLSPGNYAINMRAIGG